MACEYMRQANQTAAERVTEVRKALTVVDKLLAARKAQVKVGPQGAVTITGLTAQDRRGLSDACITRLLGKTGSSAAKLAFARAEQIAGRKIDPKVLHAGVHSHDGGKTWATH